MKMKLPDLSDKVIVIKSDQEEARNCYENSLKTKRGVVMVMERPLISNSQMELEPLEEATPEKSTPVEATIWATPMEDAYTEGRNDDVSPAEKEPEEAMPDASVGATPMGEDSMNESLAGNVQNGQPRPEGNIVERQIGGKVFKLGRLLSPGEQEEVAAVISRHLDAFAWIAADMPGIDPDFLCHHLTRDAKVRPVRQRRRKFNEERCLVVKEETQKLLSAGHIREIQYPEWLANVVLVKKANGKWRICVDFTELNKACPKDSYPLPNIDALVDSASGCKMLSFLDAFSGYNQIKMHPRDESKTAFMTETCSYCYKVMPFGLKNAGATYQRLMDKVLAPMRGRNVQAYVDDVDDMVVTSHEGG